MIVQSKLECVHQYGEVNLVPGVNMIPDNIGRELVKNRGWQELMSSKHPMVHGLVKVLVPPAPESKKREDGKPEAATANLSQAEAIKYINKCEIVDQIQTIMLLEERIPVKNACHARLEVLAKNALKEGEEDEGATNLQGGEAPPEFANDETL